MYKEKVLVTGANGLVGSRFVELNQDFELFTPEYPEFDLTSKDSIKKVLEKTNPDWIINFAAFTDVNQAELQTGDKSGLAWQINVSGTANLLDAFSSNKIIHISTDMVFPGTLEQPGPYSETDSPPNTPDHLTWYGFTKNQAEKLVLQKGGSVLRIIYPVRAKYDAKLDYIRTALKKYVTKTMYPLFADQQISLAYIDEVAETLNQIIKQNASGVFHASTDTTTPHELISYVVDSLGGDASEIKKGSIIEFLKTQSNPNRYPVYGGLKTHQTEAKLGIHFSTWQTMVEKLIGQGLSLS